MQLTISFRGEKHTLEVSPDGLFTDLQTQLEALTSIPPHLQKLLYGGKKASSSADSTTLAQAGLKNGTKIMLIGSPESEHESMRAAETAQRRREEILQQRKSANLPKVLSYPNLHANMLTTHSSQG